MPKIPKSVQPKLLDGLELELLTQGKIREIYELRDGLLLIAASDRISIFDFILGALIPKKGEILTAMTIFWLTTVFKDIPHHLVAYGKEIDLFLPKRLRNSPGLQARAIVVKQLNITPYEWIVRGYLCGSGWKSYEQTGALFGQNLPPELHEGLRLPNPALTPTTKSHEGHDIPISFESINLPNKEEIKRRAIECYKKAHEFALTRGIIILDTKIEFDPIGVIGDEIFTPDSSRFADVQEYMKCQKHKKAPPPMDKQKMRNWGITQGINQMKPDNPADLEYVHTRIVPSDEVLNTSKIYNDIMTRITGKTLRQFQKDIMGIS